MKISIVMTYFNRQFQLNKTLQSISKSKHNNFEVIIVDDQSDQQIKLPKLRYKTTVLRTVSKTWTNPEPAYNIGLIEALKSNPDIIILQNAECYHIGDILIYAEKVNNESYISFGCYSIDERTTFKKHDILKVIESNNSGALVNGENAWYNHPEYRGVGYDFCSAMTVENMRKLNGYDERFSNGCAYGDDYLIARIKMMGLKIEITKDPFVVHQWHYSNPGIENHADLCEQNRKLLFDLLPLNQIKAEHKYTPDL
jgi:glycosyltransferase involved in cell wall biosynthesis